MSDRSNMPASAANGAGQHTLDATMTATAARWRDQFQQQADALARFVDTGAIDEAALRAAIAAAVRIAGAAGDELDQLNELRAYVDTHGGRAAAEDWPGKQPGGERHG
jgi:phage-related minor tail protein